MISRRNLLLTSVSALCVSRFGAVSAGINNPGGVSGTSFNGGLTQFNTANVEASGDYTFINLMKMAQGWSYSGSPTDPTAPPIPITELDANGYITSIVAGTTGVNTVFQMPTNAQYSGQWIIYWDGFGTLSFGNMTPTGTSGSLNNNGGGAGSFTFTRGDNNSGNVSFAITAVNAAPNHVRNIRMCKIANKAFLDAGHQFDPGSIALIKAANPGAIRSLGWGGASQGTNESALALWEQRPPKSYFTYSGFYNNPAWYGGRTSHSGSDYSLNTSATFPSFALTNKVALILLFDATAPQNGNASVSSTTTATQPIVINWTAHGLAIGNAVAFGSSGAQPAPLVDAQTYFIIATNFTSNSFEVSATSGGSAVLASSSASASFTAVSIPRINVNSGGFVPITGRQIPIPGNTLGVGFSGQVPTAGIMSLVYDSTIGYFYLRNSGFLTGPPPEVFIDYCAAIGSHPHLVTPFLSVEPVSDYMTSWTTYATGTYGWMKPRVEPPNETWNTAFISTLYAQALAYVLWGTTSFTTGYANAYGKWCSTLGHAISAIYGNDRTKYSMICSIQGGNVQDDRLKSSLYVSNNGGSPAYNWVDRVCTANYYGSGDVNTVQELINAFNYTVTDAGNSAAQAAILNNMVGNCSGAGGASGNGTIEFVTAEFSSMKTWAQGINTAGGGTVAGMTCYEGGYAVNYPALSGNGSSVITAATNANPCVLTLSTSKNADNNSVSGVSGSPTPAVVGMMLDISGAAGATQLNCSSGTATFTTSSANITWTPSNPLVVGQLISFNSNQFASFGTQKNVLKAAPTPLVAGQPYFVVSTSPLQVSATKGGSAITITDASNLSAAAQSGWRVTVVSSSSISIDVDSSAFGTFSGTATAQYDNSFYYTNVLRAASIGATQLGTQNTLMYTSLAALAGVGFVSEYPSNFLYIGPTNNPANGWAVLQPDIYAPLTSQWNSIVAYN